MSTHRKKYWEKLTVYWFFGFNEKFRILENKGKIFMKNFMILKNKKSSKETFLVNFGENF